MGESLCTGQEDVYANVESKVCGPIAVDVSHLELAQSVRLWSTNQIHSAYISIQEIYRDEPQPRPMRLRMYHESSQPMDVR